MKSLEEIEAESLLVVVSVSALTLVLVSDCAADVLLFRIAAADDMLPPYPSPRRLRFACALVDRAETRLLNLFRGIFPAACGAA
jgi:hypothetical protein